MAYRGEVISGKQLGRRLNFPTANIRLPQTRLLPDGVFAVRVTVDGKTYGGMCNIGTKPTVDNSNTRQIETHLFDFSDDLYGHTITVELLAKIRDEQKFASVDKLVAQLAQDKMAAMDILQQQR
ncbi:MAG: FMN adenylyltransferase [Gammaproteobacteria bacterium]|nr:MAG: FMN adenylyltransferase [Gammaproteobacteria bacterium]